MAGLLRRILPFPAKDPTLENVLSQNHLELVRNLGKGTFGEVFEVKDRETDRTYAVKSSHRSAPVRETLYWGVLRHQNVLPLLEVVTIEGWKTLHVMPAMHQDLYGVIRSPSFRARPDALQYIRHWLKDILSGLEYMHGIGLAHLDLKTDNVLVSRDYETAVVTDFSFVTKSREPSQYWGTPCVWQPPEVHPTAPVQTLVEPERFDLWTVGTIAVELLTGHSISRYNRALHYGRPPQTCDWVSLNYPVLCHVLQTNVLSENVANAYPNANLSQADFAQLRNFVFSLLRILPEERSSAALARNHQFLGGTFTRTDAPNVMTQYHGMRFVPWVSEYHNGLTQRLGRNQSLPLVDFVSFPPWVLLNGRGEYVGRLNPSAFGNSRIPLTMRHDTDHESGNDFSLPPDNVPFKPRHQPNNASKILRRALKACIRNISIAKIFTLFITVLISTIKFIVKPFGKLLSILITTQLMLINRTLTLKRQTTRYFRWYKHWITKAIRLVFNRLIFCCSLVASIAMRLLIKFFFFNLLVSLSLCVSLTIRSIRNLTTFSYNSLFLILKAAQWIRSPFKTCSTAVFITVLTSITSVVLVIVRFIVSLVKIPFTFLLATELMLLRRSLILKRRLIRLCAQEADLFGKAMRIVAEAVISWISNTSIVIKNIIILSVSKAISIFIKFLRNISSVIFNVLNQWKRPTETDPSVDELCRLFQQQLSITDSTNSRY